MKKNIFKITEMKKIMSFNFFIFTICLFAACKKFIEVPPPSTSITGAAVFETNATAEAALNGIYGSMFNNSLGGGLNGISIMTGLSSDELSVIPLAPALQTQAYTNSLLSSDAPSIWSDCYNLIYQTNAAINGIPTSTGMTVATKNQLLGEALFLRAYCYFYLVNLYGNVPLVTSINYTVNQSLSRVPANQVYQEMITDLKQAEQLLGANYLDGTGAVSSERVRPNKEAVAALLARICLYTGDWKDAITQANQVVASGIYMLNPDPNQVFLANSPEAIWQLEPPVSGFINSNDGAVFVLSALYGYLGYSAPAYLSNDLGQSFEHGDLRKADWVDSTTIANTAYYFPFKYKAFIKSVNTPAVEFQMMLRYAEQYLILSEAYAHQGNKDLAISNLNIIRKRAGLPDYVGATDTTSVLAAIFRERRSEFFTEGQRWFDLRRSGSLNTVMQPACTAKGGTWNPDWALYPIPFSDLQTDHQLFQNPGYK